MGDKRHKLIHCEINGQRILLEHWSGAHNPERPTSMRSCHGDFTDQFIFRTILARILNIF